MAKEPFFSLNQRDLGQINFKTLDQLLDWVEQERLAWEWVQRNMTNDLGLANHERRDVWYGTLRNGQAELQKYKANQNDNNAFVQAKANLENYASSGLVSRGPRAKFITALRQQQHGDVVAQAALAAFLGEAHNKSDGAVPTQFRYPIRRGRTQMVLFDAGLAPETASQVSSALRDIGEENSRFFSDIRSANEVAMSEMRALMDTTRSDYEEAQRLREERLQAEIEQLRSEKDAAVQECKDAHSFYITQMELQAPVDYWKKKAVLHKQAATGWGDILLGYAIFGVVCLIVLFVRAYHFAEPLVTDTKSASLLVIITAGVAAGITILFWVARFLTRLYLSERHMTIDANLRTTMVMTYLALASNKQVDDKDRALVLAPLFRAGTDGIIQEDTGIDSVMALLARNLERPVPRGA